MKKKQKKTKSAKIKEKVPGELNLFFFRPNQGFIKTEFPIKNKA